MIERAREGDLPAILALDPRVRDLPGRREFLARAVAAGQCWLARDGADIAGFAVFDRSLYDQPFVSLMYAAPGRRRQGIATVLMRHVESICPTEKLFTSTNESNTPMQRLCEALGFVTQRPHREPGRGRSGDRLLQTVEVTT